MDAQPAAAADVGLDRPETAVAVVIVTFNRVDYLRRLLASLQQLTFQPQHILVVDNASSDGTQSAIETAKAGFPDGVVVNLLQGHNIGGAGGFAAGIAAAMERGVDWVWVMDDDVEVLPNALAALLSWGDRFKCIHGQRLTYDGSPFFFQPKFNAWLGVPLVFLAKLEGPSAYRQINAGCFEGMLVHSDVIREVGLPDARFFQTWDDAIYGWEISLKFPVVLVADVSLRRMRPQRFISLGIRHLNDASDSFRYYTMRNRGIVAEHLRQAGQYSPFGFAIGTALVFAKEVVRLLLVERQIRGIGALVRGWIDARTILGRSTSDRTGGTPDINTAKKPS